MQMFDLQETFFFVLFHLLLLLRNGALLTKINRRLFRRQDDTIHAYKSLYTFFYINQSIFLLSLWLLKLENHLRSQVAKEATNELEGY